MSENRVHSCSRSFSDLSLSFQDIGTFLATADNTSWLHRFGMPSFNLQSGECITDNFWRENENHPARFRNHSWIIFLPSCTGFVSQRTVTRTE